MAGRFTDGQKMPRPGVYFRTENGGSNAISAARNGVVAVAFAANWGPLNEVVTLTSVSEAANYFGNDDGQNSHVSLLDKIFMGGASRIKAVRIGTGGTKASITLKDTASTAADVVTLTAKYAGTRALSLTIKDSLSVTTQRECIIYCGTRELTKVAFAKGSDEVQALVNAVNQLEASVVSATKVADGNGTLAACAQTAFTTAGASPTTTTTDYDAAFTLLEASRWNVLCVDTNDTAVHALVKAFINRANDAGLMAMAVIGEPTSVAYATRKTNCAAFNSCNIVYCINGFKAADGTVCEGYNAAAVVAGLLACLPANDSPTHKVIPGATEVVGALTNTQIIECLSSGALVISTSTKGTVWIEKGINTLITPDAQHDEGWQKIRRTKTRFELIQRINESTERLIGNVSNDSNGRATFIAIANGIIGQMVAENKLVSGTVIEDPANPAVGDSAWFTIEVIDLDSIEKLYIDYRFSFTE